MSHFIRYPFITYATRSDMGRVRRNNEDNFFCCGQFLSEEARDLPFRLNGKICAPAVFAVFDGMGGHQSGERASLIAAQVLWEFSNKLLHSPVDQLDEMIRDYVAAVNQKIQRAQMNKSTQMGTTFAITVIRRKEVRAYNIGDSRIYALDYSGFRQISVDHTVAMTKIKSGIFTEKQAHQSDDWHKLTACLGISDNSRDDKHEILPPFKLNKNVRLLLCTDGLTDALSDDHIEWILRSNPIADKAALYLMSEALNNGGPDNVTAIVMDVDCDKFLRLAQFFNL